MSDRSGMHSAGPPAIEMRSIGKKFPENGVEALRQVDFSLAPGKIHALLGENGAGKSTLMRILAGSLHPDAGSIFLNGTPVSFGSPAAALTYGIGMVSQRPALTPGFRLWEDCILGVERAPFDRIPLFYRTSGRKRAAHLNEVWGFGLPLDAPTERLCASERQLAAVLTLLLRNTHTMIFDEPTAVLNRDDREKLFALWRRLAHEGKNVVLISHKLEETLALADELTVLRQGTVRYYGAATIHTTSLIPMMFGEENARTAEMLSGNEGGTISVETAQKENVSPAKNALSVRALCVEEPGFPVLRGVNFDVAHGEILGVASVKESGAETLELALTGFLRHISGNILVDGHDITGRGPQVFRQSGGAYLGAGRKYIGKGMFISSYNAALTIRENLLIHAHRRLLAAGSGNLLDGTRIRHFLDSVLRGADIARRPSQGLGTLSGGMNQRLINMRELAENPSVLIFAEPAWGLDQQRRTWFFRFLRQCAAEGRAIVLFFSDIDELMEVADRILVLRGGECVQTFQLDVHNVSSARPEAITRVKAAMTGAEI